MVFLNVFFTCNSAFEQGHLEPWRYKNAFIIIIIIIIIMYLDRRNMQKVELCRMRYLASVTLLILCGHNVGLTILYRHNKASTKRNEA